MMNAQMPGCAMQAPVSLLELYKWFQLEPFSFEFVSDGQGLCPWNPLGEMISPRPPQRDMYNFKVDPL